MEYMLLPLKKYAQFEGRSRRKEYWMFTLFIFIISIPISIVDMMLNGGNPESFGVLGLILQLAVLIPSIAVAVRRMHDVGKSGWYCLIPFYNIYLAIKEGDKGTNQYGPDPKNPTNELDSLGKDELV